MSGFEAIFGNSAQIIVLENLLKKKGEFTYLSGIAEDTGLSHSSVARVMEPLIKNNLVIEKKLGKQIRSFAINESNSTIKLIIKFYFDLNELKNNKEISNQDS